MSLVFKVLPVLFLIYLLLPGPASINDFPPLPNSFKSQLSGDTVQVPNVKAYFSDNYRTFAVKYYYDIFRKKSWIPFPPLKINHPPEYAVDYIKKETQSTYLEEYYYPLRDSLFVNGMEPFLENGESRYEGAIKFGKYDGKDYFTKVTLRYYPSPLTTRVLVWLGINVCIFLIIKVAKRVIKNE